MLDGVALSLIFFNSRNFFIRNCSQQNLGADYRMRIITRSGAYLSKLGAFRGPLNDDVLTKIEKFMQEVLTDFPFRVPIPLFYWNALIQEKKNSGHSIFKQWRGTTSGIKSRSSFGVRNVEIRMEERHTVS